MDAHPLRGLAKVQTEEVLLTRADKDTTSLFQMLHYKISWDCGRCGEALALGAMPAKMHALLLRCSKCGAANDAFATGGQHV